MTYARSGELEAVAPLMGSAESRCELLFVLRSYARLGGTLMPSTGKLIVLEGIDGSGKRTQMELLAGTFESRGIPFSQISFPNYHGFFGKLIAQFLNGDFGSLGAVDPHFSA